MSGNCETCGNVGCCCGADDVNLHRNDSSAEPLGAKLQRWDEYARLAHRYLIDWLREEPEELLALARGRHVWGHYRYADRNYAEYDIDRLVAEASEELGDAINYLARMLYLRDRSA